MRSKRPLGRIEPKEFDHVEKYPLMLARTATIVKPVPVVWGIDWHANFDTPVKGKDGRWRIGKGKLGPIMGGHAICSPHDDSFSRAWYLFYNQLKEGACVGFSQSIQMTLLNRERYDALDHYFAAQAQDEWAPAKHEGTSLKAGYDILRDRGPKCIRKKIVCLDDGIAANRWAEDVPQALEALGNPAYIKSDEIPLHNTWGTDYPFKVWVPCEVLQRLMNNGGECGIVTDK